MCTYSTKSLPGAPQWPLSRYSSPDCTASNTGLNSPDRMRWTPSASITVPSLKICKDIANWLPSFERPIATRVNRGSAVVTGALVRGLGAKRGIGPVEFTGGVDGGAPNDPFSPGVAGVDELGGAD